MPALCLYFQVHQPYRLRPFSFFEAGQRSDYMDEQLNREIMSRVASRCYITTGQSILRALTAHRGKFRAAFSFTGTAIEQMHEHAPEALTLLRQIVDTGAVEVLGETYHHSLASLGPDPHEFRQQVRLHTELMKREFGVVPRIFRNTELIYSDQIGEVLNQDGWRGVMVEGIPELLAGRPLHATYHASDSELRLLPRNSEISDLIAFRLHAGGIAGARLHPSDLVKRLDESADDRDVIFVCLDYETFGEHHQGDRGVCNFIEQLASELLTRRAWRFVTPSEARAEYPAVGELKFTEPRSWADTQRDLSPWQGNEMQRSAFARLYSGEIVEQCPQDLWRKLQTSDHFYYMSNKGGPDGIVHRYFSPFGSPYDAFITYMNVLRGIQQESVRLTA